MIDGVSAYWKFGILPVCHLLWERRRAVAKCRLWSKTFCYYILLSSIWIYLSEGILWLQVELFEICPYLPQCPHVKGVSWIGNQRNKFRNTLATYTAVRPHLIITVISRFMLTKQQRFSNCLTAYINIINVN